MQENVYESWVCMDHFCGDPVFCWVYHETEGVFTPWGPNSELLLSSWQHTWTDTSTATSLDSTNAPAPALAGAPKPSPLPPTERVDEKGENGLSLKSVTDKGGAADVPPCNVPRWLQEVMSRDEITVLSEAMHQNQVHESDLEFIDNDTLKKAGIVNGFSRAKILSRIKSMFKKEKE